jgi:hypothetical protein
MSIQGTYRNTVCVFVFLVSFSVPHSHCHTYSLYPNFCWLLFCWFMFIFVTRRRSSLVVARHSSSLVTRRHSSSLVVTRCSFSTRHLIVSLMRAHTHTLSLLSLSLVDCHCCSWHFRSSPSVLRLPPSRYSSPSISPFSAYVVYLLLLISHSPGTVLYCSLDTRSSALTTKSTWYSIVQKK